MTKLSGIHVQVIEQTRAAILDYLKDGPRVASEIVKKLDVSYNTVLLRLRELAAAGKVSCVKKTRTGCGGYGYVWQLNTLPSTLAARVPAVTPAAPTSPVRADPFAALFTFQGDIDPRQMHLLDKEH
jgi:hypothetical protein